MIRTVDMQSILTQSTALEKVGQTLQLNSDTNSRHFSVMSELQRTIRSSTVNDSKDTEEVKFQEDRDRDRSKKQKEHKNNNDHGSHDEDSNHEPGTLIDIKI